LGGQSLISGILATIREQSMGANSLARRALKKILYPILNQRTYEMLQAASKAWDIRSGSWREPEIDLLPFALRRGETAIDMGANFGLYSYHLSRQVGPRGKVIAFEPVPFTFETLRMVARLLRLGNVELVLKGCSDKPGTIRFTVPVQDSGAMMAGQSYISSRNDEHDGREQQVRWQSTREVQGEVVALDLFLPDVQDVSLIKADIEGAELLAFQGAAAMIDRYLPSVICEINPWFLQGFGMRLEDLTDFFFRRGYQLFFYDAKANPRLVKIDSNDQIVEDNYVFIHPSRRDRFQPLLAEA
jgi:FkbM family methyltransferase